MRRMRFDWTDLQVFLQVCEAGSMTRAATRCHLTLAAVSSRIRNLEEVNGIVLLVRHARGVSPAAAGEVVARHPEPCSTKSSYWTSNCSMRRTRGLAGRFC
jgi:hypothetical protein